jgi:hypothetical protein
MSLYSSIDRRINADEWFRELSHMGQLLWLRLLTGAHVTPLPGLWPATEPGLAWNVQFSMDEFRDAFAEITQDAASNGMPRVVADWNAGVVWLPNSLKHSCNQPKNLAVLIGWHKFVPSVPECDIKRQALKDWGAWVLENRARFRSAKGVKGLTDDQVDPLLDRLTDSLADGRWPVKGNTLSTRSRTRQEQESPNPQTEHAQLRRHYADEYLRTRGVPHALPRSQGGRYARAAAELLAAYGLDESKQIVTRALEHDWHGRNACELWQILRSASNFRGAVAAKGAKQAPTQDELAARKARAAAVEAKARGQGAA